MGSHQAGLHGSVSACPLLFEKYADFIDIYAEVREEERNAVLDEIEEHKESVMIAQIIRENANIMLLSQMLAKKYHISPESLTDRLQGLKSEQLLDLGERILECDSFEDIELWIQERKQKAPDS